MKKDWGHDASGCTILHIDMDAFYASCEIRRHPELHDKPVIIGTGARSVVSAANYEARRFGVNSAMPVSRARKLCPQGVFLPVDMKYYRDISAQVFELFSQVTDQIERVSVDECYMDVKSALLLWKSPVTIAQWIRKTVFERLGLTCSVGIASNKLIAKIASTNAKPNGMLLIPRNQHAEFIQMMPVRSLPGVGPATQNALEKYGIRTVKELAALRETDIVRAVGSQAIGHMLYNASHGEDERAVTTHYEPKSIGTERTFAEDTRDARTVLNLLRQCCDSTASHLRAQGLVARTVSVKLRFANLRYVSKACTMDVPTQSASDLFFYAKRLFQQLLPRDTEDEELSQYIRLAGISTSNLSDATATVIQPSFDDLFDEEGHDARAADRTLSKAKEQNLAAERTLDDIRQRFGNSSINFGI